MLSGIQDLKMGTKTITKFDIAEYLEDNVMIKEYLNAALEEGDTEAIKTTLGHIAKARGMSKIAEETGLSRPSFVTRFKTPIRHHPQSTESSGR